MDVKDLRSLVKSYNSEEGVIFDEVAEHFVHQVRNELEAIKDKGNWANMVRFTTIGITIQGIGDAFKGFRTRIEKEWNLTDYESFDDFDDIVEFNKFMERPDWMKFDEISGFQGEQIIKLRPFVDALMRKGFVCYVDTANYQLIASFTV